MVACENVNSGEIFFLRCQHISCVEDTWLKKKEFLRFLGFVDCGVSQVSREKPVANILERMFKVAGRSAERNNKDEEDL